MSLSLSFKSSGPTWLVLAIPLFLTACSSRTETIPVCSSCVHFSTTYAIYQHVSRVPGPILTGIINIRFSCEMSYVISPLQKHNANRRCQKWRQALLWHDSNKRFTKMCLLASSLASVYLCILPCVMTWGLLKFIGNMSRFDKFVELF